MHLCVGCRVIRWVVIDSKGAKKDLFLDKRQLIQASRGRGSHWGVLPRRRMHVAGACMPHREVAGMEPSHSIHVCVSRRRRAQAGTAAVTACTGRRCCCGGILSPHQPTRLRHHPTARRIRAPLRVMHAPHPCTHAMMDPTGIHPSTPTYCFPAS